ncbi:hypothetical protein [Halodesulfovibrio sp. MK-HDV]|jgi:hypothetical protein|uniref:hypothetical protein n=1 Tax=Halodesulfovibrio sp. MK-HDV TaxID=2599925 RepID=UPI0020B155CF|nr:hypothetical protein [Halodesulfovibrio sp. MK-HDV]
MSGFEKVEQFNEMITIAEQKNLTQLGFSFERGGAHTARTMMLDELSELLAFISKPEAEKSEYQQAIVDINCLRKRSGKTRTLTYRHLVDLYSLNPSNTLFNALLFFWNRDPQGQQLIALLCSYARDSIFRATAPFILETPEGTHVTRESLEEFIDSKEPGRFSKATLKSTAQNINSTWTKSGHFKGRIKKIRTKPVPTAGSVSYALFISYLTGARGQALFHTEYMKLLDSPTDRLIELAKEASLKGWIIFKHAGNVIEVLFPKLINAQTMELINE